MQTSQPTAPAERPAYPKFYRKGNLCLKRDSDTTTREILVPDGEKDLPLSHQHVTYPSKQRLDKKVSAMGIVSGEVYEDYLATFFQGAERIRVRFNEYRQQKFDAARQQPAHTSKP